MKKKEGDSAAAEASGARTSREEQAELEKKLESSMREFDEKLLREQEKLASRRQDPHAGAASDSSGRKDSRGGNTGSESGDNGAGSAGSAAAGQSGNGRGRGSSSSTTGEEASTGVSSAGSGGGSRARGSSRGAAPPAGIPDGNDDDIVARQLREAAQSEKDPKLRAKLWEEYCRYKKDSGGRRCRDVPAEKKPAKADTGGKESGNP